jgi:hypothetical protein
MTSNGLYGTPRPKNKLIPLSSTSIHALSIELSLARSKLSKTEKSAPARSRPSKTSELFHNKGVSSRAAKDVRDGGGKTTAELGDGGVSERDWERSRKTMKAKAKLYEKLKRGDGDGEGTLVDFDRKWAENGSAEEEEAEDDEDEELVEYEDEFGRTRTGKKSEAERESRKKEIAAAAEAERTADSSRPPPPKGIIYGNTIQTHAFQTPDFATLPKEADLTAAMPTEEEEDLMTEAHYDASKEVRTKGVGFFQFSTDNKVRRSEMEELLKERERTEAERKEKAERRKRKREEIEKRKEEVKAKRRGKVGGSWLEEQFGGLDKLDG